MRGKFWRQFRSPFLILLSVVCYLAALGQWERLEALPNGRQIVWQGKEEGLDDAACERILQNEGETGVRCALWRERKGQTIENPALSRSTDVTVWEARGCAEVLFTEFVKLSEEDPDGCYVDLTVARELFGDVDAAGMEIIWGDRRLVIRGILEEGWPIVLVRPSPKETADRIALDGNDPECDAGEFLVRHALSGAAYDDACLSGILKLLLLILPTALCTALLRELFPGLRGVRSVLPAFVLYFGFAITLVGVPLNMVPDRWSNFEFWTGWWRDWRENIRNCLEYGGSGRDTLRLLYFARGTLLVFFSFVLWSARREG